MRPSPAVEIVEPLGHRHVARIARTRPLTARPARGCRLGDRLRLGRPLAARSASRLDAIVDRASSASSASGRRSRSRRRQPPPRRRLGLASPSATPRCGSGRLLAPVLAATAAAARLALDDDRCSPSAGGAAPLASASASASSSGSASVLGGRLDRLDRRLGDRLLHHLGSDRGRVGVAGNVDPRRAAPARRLGLGALGFSATAPFAAASASSAAAGSATASTSVVRRRRPPRRRRPRPHRPLRRRRLPACGGDGRRASHGACASSRA